MKRIAITAIASAIALASLAPVASAAPGRWDDNTNNGYTLNGQWHYGHPSAAVMNQRGYQAGFHQWRRGDRLPTNFRNRYREVDYRSAHLRAPPRGYHYVRDDSGNTLLVGIATGVIASLILAGH
jgi:Ni/Co efflux regulator RcnB